MAFKTKSVGSVYFASWGKSTAGAVTFRQTNCFKW